MLDWINSDAPAALEQRAIGETDVVLAVDIEVLPDRVTATLQCQCAAFEIVGTARRELVDRIVRVGLLLLDVDRPASLVLDIGIVHGTRHVWMKARVRWNSSV